LLNVKDRTIIQYILQGPIDFEIPLPDVESLKP
jgi:hypothetical protein